MERHPDPAVIQLNVGDVGAIQIKSREPIRVRGLGCQGLRLTNKAGLFMKSAWQWDLESNPFKDALRARATCRSPGLQAVAECP